VLNLAKAVMAVLHRSFDWFFKDRVNFHKLRLQVVIRFSIGNVLHRVVMFNIGIIGGFYIGFN